MTCNREEDIRGRPFLLQSAGRLPLPTMEWATEGGLLAKEVAILEMGGCQISGSTIRLAGVMREDKLLAGASTRNGFTIAHPADAGKPDVAEMDSPNISSNMCAAFCLGSFEGIKVSEEIQETMEGRVGQGGGCLILFS